MIEFALRLPQLLYRRAAAKGHQGAQRALAGLLAASPLSGRPRPWTSPEAKPRGLPSREGEGERLARRQEAVGLLRQASRQGHRASQVALAEVLADEASGEALEWLEEAADQGDRHACYALAGWHRSGRCGCRGGERSTRHWTARAAALGHAAAQYEEGERLHSGGACGSSAAAVWFARSACGGDARGQCNIGVMLSLGLAGFPWDPLAARRWFAAAAEQDNARAAYNLALLHGRGEGGPRDACEAVTWCARAASLGLEEAGAALPLFQADLAEATDSHLAAATDSHLAAATDSHLAAATDSGGRAAAADIERALAGSLDPAEFRARFDDLEPVVLSGSVPNVREQQMLLLQGIAREIGERDVLFEVQGGIGLVAMRRRKFKDFFEELDRATPEAPLSLFREDALGGALLAEQLSEAPLHCSPGLLEQLPAALRPRSRHALWLASAGARGVWRVAAGCSTVLSVVLGRVRCRLRPPSAPPPGAVLGGSANLGSSATGSL